jgi:23S rRNA (pseudouridine1915-N3)-methyltransferase
MRIKILWPGKTRDQNLRELQDSYLVKINRLEKCELIETKEARGFTENMKEKILSVEANGLEKHMKGDYIICLVDRGKEMNSEEFARFLKDKEANSAFTIVFIVGGFLGLADRILERSHFLLSLSKLTFSHELSRVVLLEQIYRSLTIVHGRQYAK